MIDIIDFTRDDAPEQVAQKKSKRTCKKSVLIDIIKFVFCYAILIFACVGALDIATALLNCLTL